MGDLSIHGSNNIGGLGENSDPYSQFLADMQKALAELSGSNWDSAANVAAANNYMDQAKQALEEQYRLNPNLPYLQNASQAFSDLGNSISMIQILVNANWDPTQTTPAMNKDQMVANILNYCNTQLAKSPFPQNYPVTGPNDTAGPMPPEIMLATLLTIPAMVESHDPGDAGMIFKFVQGWNNDAPDSKTAQALSDVQNLLLAVDNGSAHLPEDANRCLANLQALN